MSSTEILRRKRRGTGPLAAARHRPWLSAVAAIGMVAAIAVAGPAAASHPEASLLGSNFEIDVDANLKVDDAAPSIDWASVNETRGLDKINGTGDNSYSGGVKEDTVCPTETTDSIPPNKSDLLSFHVYREPGVGTHPGFLNLAWSRVSDPSGTTLMDFEFNQSSVNCASGPNKQRTAGDLLIEYAIDQGGSRADITARTWTGSAWGPTADLDVPSATCGGQPCAAGTINTSTIPAAESDGLISEGVKQARTFGEAQIDLRLIFQPNKCASFGTALLKSRSSDSFTSQLKDFVSPLGINLQNCGQVIIRKETEPDENPNTTLFGYTKTFGTDPTSANTFTLTDDGVKDYGKTVLFGSGYTVTEDVIPAGWTFKSLSCAASTGVSPTIVGAQVTFAIDDASDILDCTYTNESKGAIQVTKTMKHAASGPGDHPQAGVTFTVKKDGTTVGTIVTDANGTGCLGNLLTGAYTVTETVPAGYAAAGAVTKNVTVGSGTCASGAATVSFSNLPLTDLTVSVTSQISGGTNSKITCTGLSPTPADATPSAFDDTSETVKDLVPGTYTCTVVIDP